MGDEEMRRVILRDFPVGLLNRARQHSEALVREFALIVYGGGEDTRVPSRLVEIAAESDARYAGLNPEAEDIVDAALARGEEYVDLELRVPLDLKQHTLDSIPVLLEVEEYCRTGQMLTLLTPADVRRFWTWYLGEFLRQLDELPPISWRDWQRRQQQRE